MKARNPIQDALKTWPETEAVDVIIADMNGIWRGKQIPVAYADKIMGLTLPMATPILTTSGAVSEAIAETLGTEPDMPTALVEGSVCPVLWATRPTLQVQIDLLGEDGQPFLYSPRTVLKRQVETFKAKGLTPVIGIELEFHLFKAGSIPPEMAEPMSGQVQNGGENCYTLDLMYDFEPLLIEIEQAAVAQGLPVSVHSAESSHNQFEINLMHRADALKAADEAMLLQRVVRGVANKHGMLASFMAKPLADKGGSGLHVHMSLLDEAGENIFAQEGADDKLMLAIAGQLALMPASTALFAPNANSYRRFDPEWYAPVTLGWAHNNRFMAVRTPPGEGAARRFEHRAAGSDASPHLVVAAVLAAALKGLEDGIQPPEPYGVMTKPDHTAPRVPERWYTALAAFKESEELYARIGPEFCAMYHAVRAQEERERHKQVPLADYEAYLRLL